LPGVEVVEGLATDPPTAVPEAGSAPGG
jgi:hypothetical protein